MVDGAEHDLGFGINDDGDFAPKFPGNAVLALAERIRLRLIRRIDMGKAVAVFVAHGTAAPCPGPSNPRSPSSPASSRRADADAPTM